VTQIAGLNTLFVSTLGRTFLGSHFQKYCAFPISNHLSTFHYIFLLFVPKKLNYTHTCLNNHHGNRVSKKWKTNCYFRGWKGLFLSTRTRGKLNNINWEHMLLCLAFIHNLFVWKINKNLVLIIEFAQEIRCVLFFLFNR